MSNSLTWNAYDRFETYQSSDFELGLTHEEINRHWLLRHNELNMISKLLPDWDGLGADVPNSDLYDTAVDLFNHLGKSNWEEPPSRILPSPEGTIIFEWTIDGMYLEAEICEPWCIEWMQDEEGADPEYWSQCWRPRKNDAFWEVYYPSRSSDLENELDINQVAFA
ncbi:MAG: hypothetical protein KZQ82_07110 [Candidatus Thiodiazotropha sp. (ex Lucinoma annulata)]|nr:hypothetical protein [Candidatus Thiodiazotropha sp. (ex Lucinoma annulata)]